MRPGIDDLEVVAAVGEVRSAAHDSYVPDGEVMSPAKMITKVRIVDAAHVIVMAHLVVPFLVVMFFLSRLIVVLILSDSHRRYA
jgi:hypothetical protein